MTQIFAHRGAAGTHPENTMISFYEAYRVGADGIELDVQLSKDGEVVVIHDELLDRTTNGKGNVKDHTWNDLQLLSAGYKFRKQFANAAIPNLEEVLAWIQGTNMILNIELKNSVYSYPGLEEKVIALVRTYSMESRVILSSFNHYSLVHAYRIAPDIETAPLYRDGLYMPWVYATSIGARAIHPSIHMASDAIVVASMKEGVAVRPYTINKEDKMRHLFEIGISAFITDFPERAVKLRGTIEVQ
ncbi:MULTISPECIES: glycerophosphodiester phosphodiesterase [Bacillaceae]|uniref:Glycerophosphoryl diester phosphodiesterase n=1 Tax=Peribacillus huizhouensis TaxID=1501239 RepID=A0ABR6CSN7_9BACI|nr:MULTISPECIES: glycerophosphodiester phosphodiesterase [Bacillaceae]MBA9027372.1 glycerophosphoryl diester phosphodiesterase [Peribacillus huizhouensis]